MSDILAEGRAHAEAYSTGAGQAFKNAGRKNAYQCESCQSYIVTIDRHPDVTPFGVKCGNCGGSAYSKMYKVADWLEPTHEWYRPDSLEGIPKAVYEHLRKGGLILRAIDAWKPPLSLSRSVDVEAVLRKSLEHEKAQMVDKLTERHKSVRDEMERACKESEETLAAMLASRVHAETGAAAPEGEIL